MKPNALRVLVLCAAFGSSALTHAETPPDGEAQISAKALFFGTDGKVKVVRTALPPAQGAQAIAGPATVAAVAKPQRAPGAARPVSLGASYFVRVHGADGSKRDVLASHDFRTGERFQIGVKVNKPANVYIYNREADGRLTQLFPQPGQAARIAAMGTVFLPLAGSFEFTGQPGVEQVSVLLSDRVLSNPEQHVRAGQADVESVPASEATAVACAHSLHGADLQAASAGSYTSGELASKSIAYRDGPASCDMPPKLASKGIRFVNDSNPEPGGQVASYVVKPGGANPGQLHLNLRLSHR